MDRRRFRSAPPRPAPLGSALSGPALTDPAQRAGTGDGASSHGLGLDDAIALAAALDRMPGRLVVHAIEAADLTQGPGLSPPVAAAVDTVARAVLADLNRGRVSRGPG